MEFHDGFIVGIDHYCDRWCERCPFTSYCRVFADVAEMEAALDPAMQAIAPARPMTVDVATPLMSCEDWDLDRPTIAPEHEPIDARATGYSRKVFRWMTAHESRYASDPADPRAVIAWFHTIIPVKVHRALHGLTGGHGESDHRPDQSGSAKVALLAIEESRDAWLELVVRGLVTGVDAEPFVAELEWLADALERAVPNARAFIRPAFDEPEAVARLRVMEP